MAQGGHPRIYQLDAVRGLLAIGVMLYHAGLWLGTPALFVLGTWGVYGFFVLSGWAMEHVYGDRLDVGRFIVARVARLAPLWVPVVLVSAVIYGTTEPGRVLLNVTGAFGFVSPGATEIPVGGWSIGIEAALYVGFVVLTLVRISTPVLAVLTTAAIAARFAWVGGLMPVNLEAEWIHYTAIPSFLCFFLGGMLAARTVRVPMWSGRRARIAAVLGDMSYGVYLLHPLIWTAVGPAAVLVTPAVALAIHRLYEVPVGRAVRRLGDAVHVKRRADHEVPATGDDDVELGDRRSAGPQDRRRPATTI